MVLEAVANNKEKYYMQIAELTALRSKDLSTKVGCCLVKDGRILSIGYNGAPKGYPDHEVPTTNTDNLIQSKNTYMVHAEVNSILNYKGQIDDIKGASVYVTISPCHECAKVLAQCGVSEIIYLNKYHNEEIYQASQIILDACGVKIRKYEE